MNMKMIASATASAALALAMGANAMAADAGVVNTEAKKPGISFVDRGGRGGLKDLVVEAGTDPSTVELHFAGAQKITFGDVGTLVIVKADGSLWRYKPLVYQIVNGKRKFVSTGFHFVGRDRVSLRVDKLDPSAPLIVAPVSGKNGNS
jgi:hypothetical protein